MLSLLLFLLFLLAVSAGIWLWLLYSTRREDRRRWFAEFRAAVERGEGARVHTGCWVDWPDKQVRTVTWAHLKPGYPANWWDYDPAEVLEISERMETQPYPPGYSPFLEWASGMRAEPPWSAPGPASQPGTTPQRPNWSPPVAGVLPGTGMTSLPTAAQVYMYNTQGATAVNAARNGANVS
jgi:hypothetical protein